MNAVSFLVPRSIKQWQIMKKTPPQLLNPYEIMYAPKISLVTLARIIHEVFVLVSFAFMCTHMLLVDINVEFNNNIIEGLCEHNWERHATLVSVK